MNTPNKKKGETIMRESSILAIIIGPLAVIVIMFVISAFEATINPSKDEGGKDDDDDVETRSTLSMHTSEEDDALSVTTTTTVITTQQAPPSPVEEEVVYTTPVVYTTRVETDPYREPRKHKVFNPFLPELELVSIQHNEGDSE